MTELEKIAYAKSFIDKLANGINPLDDTPIPDGDITNNVRLSRCFFYVSDVLRQVVESGGIQSSKTNKRCRNDFHLTDEQRDRICLSNRPLTVSEISDHLNSLIDLDKTKKITAATINDWLVNIELLQLVEQPNGKNRKLPTKQGLEMGIITEERSGQHGTYVTVMYPAAFQQFIYDNIESIVNWKAEKSRPISAFHNRVWTKEHDERLIELYKNGTPVSEIAYILRRTDTGVQTRLNELGLLSKKIPSVHNINLL